ncbi:MAG: NUDIX hydrolase [Nevskiaceae bacterium]|nr:NUDIX hydrolase [Nevskiaceae bacterium]
MTPNRFCPHCGAPTAYEIPPGDNRPRQVCPACQAIHYENPRIVVGCVPEYQGRILICRRVIEPRRGYWTIPAGFMENGETLAQGAARECFEEALARVEIGSMLSIVDIPEARQVHVFFRARLIDGSFGAGPESLESQLVDESGIPWAELAFPSSRHALRGYLADRAAGREELHRAVMSRRFDE